MKLTIQFTQRTYLSNKRYSGHNIPILIIYPCKRCNYGRTKNTSHRCDDSSTTMIRRLKQKSKRSYSLNKLNSLIKTHKDLIKKFFKNNVVYKINCKECTASYVG